MTKRSTWVTFAVCSMIAGCGLKSGSDSESLAVQRAKLDSAAHVSPDFPLDQDAAPEFNPNVVLLSVAGSTAGGYLLAYSVPYAPEYWSRLGIGYSSNRIELVHWDAVSGPSAVLTELPAPPAVATFGKALVLDVGSRWLVAYEVVSSGTTTRYSVTVARDGTLGTPVILPGVCATGLSGFARATDTALLTDDCGGGVLLDLNGNVSKTLTLVDVNNPISNCTGYSGGQVAFNGIDFVALYACLPEFNGNVVVAPSVSPSGVLGASALSWNSDVPYAWITPLSIAGKDGKFLAVAAQGRSSGPGTATAVRVISESASHVFSAAAEQLLPGEILIGDATGPSDRKATALALADSLAVVRELPAGNFDLVSANDLLTAISLPTGFTNAPMALVSSSDPFNGGTSFVIGAGARAVRFDASSQAIDDPPAVLLSAVRGQFEPSVAFDGQSYLAVWTEGLGDPSGLTRAPQVFGHRISENGALLESASFRVGPESGSSSAALATASPGLFSVAWGNGSQFAGATTVTSEPPVITQFPVPATFARDFDIASDGTHTTVAWAGVTGGTIQIAQLADAGTWSPQLTIATSTDLTRSAPALAFNGGQYAVLWTSEGSVDTERVLSGARVSSAMTLLDTTPKELLRFTVPLSTGDAPVDSGVTAIASGDHFLFAWVNIVSGTEQLRVARLSSTLEVLDAGGVLAATQSYEAYAPATHRSALGWDGTNDWVVWRDNEGGARRPFASLRGRRFSAALAPVDSASFSISSDLDEFSKVTLAGGASGPAMVGYTRYLASAGSFRARARFLETSPFADGLPCGSAADCQNGACVGGRCSTATGAGGEGGEGGELGAAGGTTSAGGISAGGISAGGSSAGGSSAGVDSGGASVGGGMGRGGVAGNNGSAGEATGGSTGGAHASGGGGTGGEATAGSDAAGGSAPSPDSCSCRVAGGRSTEEPLPFHLALLAVLGAALGRRRRSSARRDAGG